MRVTRQPNGQPPALLLALHGAGSGGAPGGLYAFRGAWDVPGLVIVAPAAAGSAWTLGEPDVSSSIALSGEPSRVAASTPGVSRSGGSRPGPGWRSGSG